MTWSLEPQPGLAGNAFLQAEVAALVEEFAERLDVDAELESLLPGYRRDLPYHRRLLAAALGSSLRASAGHGGLLSTPARSWLGAAGRAVGQRLLTSGVTAGEDACATEETSRR
jgi:hypothetical protein